MFSLANLNPFAPKENTQAQAQVGGRRKSHRRGRGRKSRKSRRGTRRHTRRHRR